MLTRLGPPLTILLLTAPVLVGLLWTLLPAFGYLPALGGETLSLEPFRALFAQPGLLRSCLLSLVTGLASGALSLTITMLFIAAWSGTRAFARLQRLLSPLLAIPHAAAAFGLAFLIAPSGLLVRLVSPELTGWTRPPDVLIVNDPYGLALTAGLVLKEVPFLFLLTLAALPQADATRARAVVAALGYGRMTGFLAAVWPQLYRQIRLGVFAVIAFSTSVVDVAAILGPTAPPVLAQRLILWMNDPDLGMRFMAAAGAILQLALTLSALLVWLGLERIASATTAILINGGRRWQHDRLQRRLILVLTVLLVATTFAGLVTLGLWSVSGLWTFPQALPQSVTLRGWADVLPRLVRPLTTTLIVALASAALALVLAVLCLRNEDRTGRRAGSRALWLIYLPLIVPQVAFLFGLQLLFLTLGFTASLAALVLVHLVFVLPYTFLSLSDPWRAFDRRYEQVAAGLGRSPSAAFWRIRLPMLTRALLTAFAIGLAVSIGLYLPTVLIGAGRLTTVTTEAVALAAGGNRRVIGIWAFVQMVLPFAGFLVATLVPALIFPAFSRNAGLILQSGLELSDVEIALGERCLLALNARVARGSVLTVMGPSGSGKSTLLAYVGGFLDTAFRASGSVRIAGEDVTGQPAELRHAGILFQDPLLFPHMTVAGNLLFGLSPEIRGRAARHTAVETALGDFGLEGMGDRDPVTLSGGQKSRVALSRVLLSQPRTLLLDEPFSKLDASLRAQMRDLVFSAAKSRGLPVLLVTHDEADAQAAAGDIVRIG